MEEQQQIRWMGGMSTGQDVSIRLVRSHSEGNEPLAEILGVVQVHSSVLTVHSKYFSERLRDLKTRGQPESTCDIKKFVLEAQADVECYFYCFGSMYTPVTVKNDVRDIQYGLGLLKVASQIEFHELIESTSLCLSSRFWSPEDESRIREYTSTPNFPRNQAKDLVTRLGLNMDKSEQEYCNKQFWLVTQEVINTALNPEVCDKSDSEQAVDRAFIAELLQGSPGLQAMPSDFVIEVAKLVTSKAKSMMVCFGSECEWVKNRTHKDIYVSRVNKFGDKVVAICWVLRALLKQDQAEELVSCFVHVDAIPGALNESLSRFLLSHNCIDVLSDKVWEDASKLADVVLMMYREVVAGRLVLKSRERMALLANWHPLLKKVYVTAEAIIANGGDHNLVESETQLNLVARELFSTLPLKEQMEFIAKQDNAQDFITNNTFFAFTVLKSLASHGIAPFSN